MRRLAWPAAISATIALAISAGILIIDSYGPRPFIIGRPDRPVHLLTGDMPLMWEVLGYLGCGQGERGTTTLLLDDVYGTAAEVFYRTPDGENVFRGPLAWPVGTTARRTGDVVELLGADGVPFLRTGEVFEYEGYALIPPIREGVWVGSPIPAGGAFWRCGSPPGAEEVG